MSLPVKPCTRISDELYHEMSHINPAGFPYIENGADASTMHGVCEETRVVAMGVTKNMRLYEPLDEFQNFLIHDLYHALQQDLEMEGKCRDMRKRDERNSNRQFLVEGAAHYFATWLVAEINNTSNHESQILKVALWLFEREGENMGPDKWGQLL